MYFDEKYFETEERDGFVVESTMKRAWAAEIEVLLEIDKICKNANGHYQNIIPVICCEQRR